MRKNLLAKIADYLARNRRYRIWAKVVGALACVVVFITTYMLILPAITLEKTPFCGLEEHTHTQECYRKVEAQTVSVLDCSLESLDIHTHTADCYDDEGELQCGYADFVVHTHDSSCYDAKGNQVCQLPEIKEHLHTENCYVPTAEGHTHTDACYTIQNGDLVCQLSEGEDHQHSDACYEQEKILICGLEETEASEPQLICDKPEVELHTHTSTCYDENDNLVCDKLEVLEHVHGEECFELLAVSDDELTCGLGEDEKHTHTDLCYGQWELVCELTEHTHTESCYEVETEADEDAAASAVEAEAEAGGIMPLSDELPVEVVAGGDIEGTELTWTFTKNLAGEYTLTISGEGAIPDYSAYGAPWNDYISKTAQNLRTSLVIEEGITGIGQYAFIGGNFVDASLPDTLTSIGYGAFQGCAFTSINIPGSVKTLARQSFAYCSALRSITLNEGLESLDGIAFWYSGLQELHLPASLTTITDGLRNIAGTITVAEGNECFKVVDGVLFQLNEDKTAWKLTAYPTNLPGESYTVPAEIDGKPVKEIASCAFYQVTQLLNITIPESVTAISSSAFQVSSLQTAVLECTTLQSNPGGFIDATNLREIDISHLTGAIPREFFKNSHLSSITIPEGITSIGLSAFQGCSYLNEVVYDAQNATCGITVMGISDLPRYDLTIGTHVDVLNQSFSQIAGRADSLRFEGPNQITIAEGALAGAPEPFSTLSGDIYVDKNGLIYIYDKETRTASLFYCPPGVETATVPAAITPEDGATCTVTAVTMNALKYAVNLESITFETPESIVSLDAYALANCPTLTSANGKTNVKDALVSFPKAERGYNVFYNTGLDGASGDGSFETDMDGRKSLSVSKTGAPELDIIVNSDGGTMEWIFDDEGSDVGGYRLLTGDTLTVTASVGNTEGDSDDIYRIYLRLTNEDGSLSVEPGQSYTFNGQTVTCHATEDPYTVYLEFQAPIGVTLSFPVTAVYPSPDSPGGGLTVWGCILTPEEAEANENLLMESQSDSIQAYWTTEPDNFVLAKTGTGISALSVIGDGAGGAMPNANLNWQIKLNREMETTSAYGKDYAESADFTDVLTLPEGVSWKESVIEAIQSGNVWWNGNYLYADDVMVASLSLSGSGLYLTGRQVEWDAEKNTAVFHWRVLSGTEMAEMNASTVSFIICDDALSVDMAIFAPTEKSTITNTANAIVHYNYSEDKELTSNATKTITGGTGNIKLTKTATDVHYFGEDITYTLDVYNNGGLPWTGVDGVYTLSDPLSQYVYISPENLQRMFMEEYGEALTVTIQNASLGTWEEVTGTDGSEAWRHPGNSDLGAAENTLTVTKAADGTYSVAVLDGETYSGTTVGEALQKAGFGVTDLTVYTCVWTLNEETEACTLEGGEHRVFQIYATAKNTFQMMSSDWPNEYPSDSTLTIPNTAKVLTPTGKTVATVSTSKTVKRESRIDKTVYRDGQLLYDSPAAADGDILEYHLDFTHYGTGGYQDLPMVDDLYGSQYLLVPVASNPDLAWLETHGDYYILTEGTYQNVVVGVDDEGKALTAATITVQQATEETEVSVGGIEYSYTGLHTQIKWYFPDLEGGNYRSTVTYQALVSTALTGVNYTIGNVVWMNDREGARIYDTLWGGGTIIDFQKDIVTEKGSSPALDVLDEDGYSLVEAGEKVTYRLTLENPGTGYFKLNGTDLADALPETLGVFEWEKDVNVTDFRVEIVGKGVEAIGLENWNLGNRYLNLLGERQYILWSDASITFTEPSTVYLYFTLTYPEDSDDSDTWSRYAAAVGGGMLNNTMYVYRFPSMVTHGLRESGQVMLQKGVHGMYYYATNNTYWYVESGNSRQFYNNRDSKSRAVAYYVTLYNDGNKRLYLDDLYDQLPQGFTYKVMLADGNITNTTAATVRNTITTVGGTNQGTYPLTDWSASDVVFRSAGITATRTADGVKFSTGKGSGLYAVKYDEEQQQYYLDKGEAIVFGYLCDIGTSVQTETSATNTIAMPYTDYLNTGVVVVDRDSLLVNAPDSEQFVDYNDGSRMTKSNSQVSEDYGFANSDQQTWLVSDVTVSRGGIIPGVTKYAESYTNTGGITASYVNSVGPFDKVNWRVRLHNSGTLSLADYTFTDIMPAPYTIEGPVTFTIYDGNGNSVFSATACTFPTNRTGGEESITVTRAYTAGGNVTVPFDGTESSVWAVQTPLYLSLSRDESGNEIMQLNFQWANLAIPEGGYMDVCFSSRNPTNEYANTVYTNQAILTPNAQEFTTVQQGSMVRDEDGRPVSVNNSAPITVSFGYHTSSEKRVTETADTTNTAVSSNQENNVILLSSADSDFIYTLTVKNETEAAMTKLILIDNLPEPDDHSPFHTAALRGSEFQVDLADNPNFEVTVTTEDGTNYQLDSKYYSVEYSTDNDFGGPESEDWTGESTGTTAKWTNDSNGARAIRVIIRDESATQIPAGANISITFHAKVSGQAEAGGIAWNSFGYHYALKGVATELEAMPLVVGVQIPSIPALEKQLVDSNGEPVNAPKDSSFSFLAYEGAALENSYDTAEALIEALIADGRDYKQFDLTVEAGETTSGSVFLSDWNWKEGQQYTIVELPCDNSYAFHSFYGSRTAAYTFTYDPTETFTILCKNTFQQWKLSLTKVDGDSQGDDRQPLSGAVFALYSPNEKDQQEIPDEFSSLIIESVIEQGDQTWYLANVAASDEDGKLDFGDLMRDNYYLLEVKAPDGYNLNDPAGRIVYRDGAEQGIYTLTVANFAGYKLPESGGTGTTMIYIGGLLAMMLACFLLYRKNKRGKEDIASS